MPGVRILNAWKKHERRELVYRWYEHYGRGTQATGTEGV